MPWKKKHNTPRTRYISLRFKELSSRRSKGSFPERRGGLTRLPLRSEHLQRRTGLGKGAGWAQPSPEASDAAGMGRFGAAGLVVRPPATRRAGRLGIFNLQLNGEGVLHSLNGNRCA